MGNKQNREYTAQEHFDRAGKYIIDNVLADHRSNRYKMAGYHLPSRVENLLYDYKHSTPSNYSSPVRIIVSETNGVVDATLVLFVSNKDERVTAKLPISQIIREDRLKGIMD